MAEILDGKRISAQIRGEIRAQVKVLSDQNFLVPGLAVLLVGENPASNLYVSRKQADCREVGFFTREFRFAVTATQEEILACINSLNADEAIHGILVQLPLPKHLNEQAILRAIASEKDVDGFHPLSMGKLITGEETFFPCTPFGIIELLHRHSIPIAGKKALVIGRSNIVGKPMALLLLREHATVTIAHSRTINMEQEVAMAEILVVSIGKPTIIPGKWIRPGAVVIDVGINFVSDPKDPGKTRLIGDVDFEGAQKRAAYITPVPGGVGPMTRTMLLLNTLKARNNLSCTTKNLGE